VCTTLLSFLPGSIQHTLLTLFSSVQSLLAERWEWRVLAILCMLPTATFALLVAGVAVALLWPFTFLALTVGGLAITAGYLFWPNSADLKTCLFSLVFSLGCQLLVALPIYLLAPFGLFVVLALSACYLAMSGSWLLLTVTGWWLLTTPYWSLIHFVTFPVLFAASLALQLLLAVSAFIAVSIYPALPSDAARYYAALIEERTERNSRYALNPPHSLYHKETKGHPIDYPIKEEESKTQ